ncbi:hypothetical protein DRE_01065 [Drechslerella stenobrocha 248]|uniref:1,3-beta-glucanosyltransferase n=1 Tax=Drechslerella stenobrocha 248 TaxID=1043628 RepID=W7HMA7_9PEZI|nr:hypothetical protein DRE_01065 [Drechslerella stenobrocha 248]
MKSGYVLAALAFGASTVAAVNQLLFHYDFTGDEDIIAGGGTRYNPYPYNWTYDTVTAEEWDAMSTNDFKQYKAIIIGDPVSTDPEDLDALMESRKNWGPAIEGNVILIGTDTSNHFSRSRELMVNGIAFAATGKGTGLYFSLSKYYGDRNKTSVPILDIFGDFSVRGDLNAEQEGNCYDNVHIVAKNTVLDGITDKILSNWTCSVHEAFVTYPSTGSQSFVPLAIAQGVPGEGSRTFSDGTSGIPYILVRGASPIGCGTATAATALAAARGTMAPGVGAGMASGTTAAMAPGVGAGMASGTTATMAPGVGAGIASGTTAATAAGPTAAATGGGLTATQAAGTSFAAGFASLAGALFGRRKKKNKDGESDSAAMPVPPMPPSDMYSPPVPEQYYTQQQYHPAPQGQQPMFAPPIPLPMNGFDDKEIKSGETSYTGSLNVGVQEVMPTPSHEVHGNPIATLDEMPISEQPYIPPPIGYHEKVFEAGGVDDQPRVPAPAHISTFESADDQIMPVVEQPYIPPPPGQHRTGL